MLVPSAIFSLRWTLNYPGMFRDEFSQAQRWPPPQAPIYSSVELLKSDFWRWFHLLCRIWERGCSNTAAVISPQYWSSQCWVMLRAVTARRCPFKIILNVEANCCELDKNIPLHICDFKYWGKIVAVYSRWMQYFSVCITVLSIKITSFNDILRTPFKKWKHLYLSRHFQATVLICLEV